MSNYGMAEPSFERDTTRKRRSFKEWLRDKLNRRIEKDNKRNYAPTSEPILSSDKFSKNFEGWNIRLHRANGGHIVEAWKYEENLVTIRGGIQKSHELFMVLEGDDMGEQLNSILVQLMLRG